MRLFAVAFAAAGLLLLAAAPRVQAQTTGSSRLYRGLFGPGTGASGRGQSLDATIDLLGAYDNDLAAGPLGLAPDPRVHPEGTYSTGSGLLRYRNQGAHGALEISGGTVGRYFPGQTLGNTVSEWGTASVTRDIARRNHLSLSGQVSYAPYYQLDAFAASPTAIVAGSTLDYSVLYRPALAYGGNLDFVRDLSPRLSLEALSSFRRTDATTDAGTLDDYSAGGRLRYSFSRYGSVHAGYIRQEISSRLLTAHPVVVAHQIDVGVDYARALSLSRHLTFGFTTASTLVSVADATTSGRATRFSLLGSAFLNQDIGRSWYAQLQYQRSLEILEITAQPFFVDSAIASVGGYLGPRVDLRWLAGYSNGTLTAGGHGFVTWDASMRARVALVRNLAVYAEYLFYHYDFTTVVPLPAGLDHQLDRQGVRVGLTWWIPLFR